MTARRSTGGSAAATTGPETVRPSDFVRSLERGLAVVGAFATAERLTASDVAADTGLTRAAARRFLLTLADLGYVRTDGRSFRLAPRVLELPAAFLSGLRLPDVALPHLRSFVDDVRESSSVAVLDGDDVVYVEHVTANRVLSVAVTVGARDPACVTSLGRVLLAAKSDAWLDAYLSRIRIPSYTKRTVADAEALREELGRVRKQGWALVDEELEDGLRAVAAPIRDAAGDVVGAANVGLHTSRWRTETIKSRLLPRLLRMVDDISVDLANATAATRTAGDVGEAAAAPRASHFVQSLERGFAVIRAFSGSGTPLTLSEVAASAGLTRAAARRFLLTLVRLGYIATDGRRFTLTPKVLELARAYSSRVTLAEVARPHLSTLASAVRESSSLAVLDGRDVLYLAEESTPRILSVIVPVGGRDPAWATSLGRVLLAAQEPETLEEYLSTVDLTPFTRRTVSDVDALRAELARVRRQGWALVDEEFEEGLRAIAAPVRDRTGRVVAAVNVAVHSSRWRVGTIRSELLPQLERASASIGRDLTATRISLTH